MYEHVCIQECRNIDQAISFIKEFEGFKDKVYYCQARIPTIGYGHVIRGNARDRKYLAGAKITKKEAENLLIEDLQLAMNVIDHLVILPLTDNQYAALLSFSYNIGNRSFKGSVLLKELNSFNIDKAADEFLRWDKIKVNGIKLTSNGLKYRRERERALFLTPTFDFGGTQ